MVQPAKPKRKITARHVTPAKTSKKDRDKRSTVRSVKPKGTK